MPKTNEIKQFYFENLPLHSLIILTYIAYPVHTRHRFTVNNIKHVPLKLKNINQ